ncbi:TetR/AcrR family transcriptional regulator [Frankia sp. R82]|uniref:TetR/AcrR family transcriptional regulator n=1 Tax=Frankia sp. R82 TaxID=2950553 RepID=UPI002043AD59|nr:helix-turn-helix domain-containing protein [Frankia sp. R82]MCM3884364.1 TetR/AcrR family transcriptional regulator [Frankia sp. R82]
MADQAETAPRQLRSHARRHRDRILAVARDAFANRNGGISLNEVARRAGVGAGTLFRHVPNRDALLGVPADAAGGALFDWLTDLVDHVAAYHGVSAALLTEQDADSALHAACHAVAQAATSLLRRAQQTGAVRADLAPDELISLIGAISWAKEQAPNAMPMYAPCSPS